MLKCTIPSAIEKVQSMCDISLLDNLDETEKQSLITRWREILLQGFTFGFEVIRKNL